MENRNSLAASACIADFLAHKRIAVVGVSRNAKELSRTLFREFLRGGYDAIPVNPWAENLDGRTCYPNVRTVQPAVDGVLIIAPAHRIEAAVKDCLEAGVSRIWIHLGSGSQPLPPDLRQQCENSGVSVIRGFCPLMFLPRAGWFHHLHGWFAKHSSAYRV